MKAIAESKNKKIKQNKKKNQTKKEKGNSTIIFKKVKVDKFCYAFPLSLFQLIYKVSLVFNPTKSQLY